MNIETLLEVTTIKARKYDLRVWQVVGIASAASFALGVLVGVLV